MPAFTPLNGKFGTTIVGVEPTARSNRYSTAATVVFIDHRKPNGQANGSVYAPAEPI
jgi:hypothetical protein